MTSKEFYDNGNLEIAKMMGWTQDGPQGTWYEILGAGKYVAYSQHSDQFNELPFHKDWNWLFKAKCKIVELTGKVIRERTMKHVNHIDYEVDVSEGHYGESVNHEMMGNMTEIDLLFTVISELAAEYNKTQENGK